MKGNILKFRLFLGFLLLVLLLIPVASHATSITQDEAVCITKNWLVHYVSEVGDWGGEKNIYIEKIEEVKQEGILLGYNVSVWPKGHVLVPALRELPPVKSFSTENRFNVHSKGYEAWILAELEEIVSILQRERAGLESADIVFSPRNTLAWEWLSEEPNEFVLVEAGKEVESVTVGPLLTTKWAQGPPYNMYCPEANSCCWSTPQTIAAVEGQTIHDSKIAVDGDGNWHVVYLEVKCTDGTLPCYSYIRYENSNLGSDTIVQAINPEACQGNHVDSPAIAVDSNGNLHVTYREIDFSGVCGEEITSIKYVSGCARTVVGCVATAAAQIMKYWNWPPSGTGSHCYTWDGCGCGNQELCATFSDPYDWSNMPDILTASSSSAQKEAVAELCYEVGVAFEMDYGCSSGASTGDALTVFPTYFKYSSDISRIDRSNYASDDAWFTEFMNEIDAARPVQLAIRTPDPPDYGHSVVVDGYRQDGGINQVHINFGWAGSYDTFYSLNNIVAGGYSWTNVMAQYAITNIHPTRPNISVSPTNHDFGDVTVGTSSAPQIFTISNTGTGDLVIDTLSIIGTDASEFGIQNDNCSWQTIAPSGTCPVDVVFSPTSEGLKSANLSIPSNDPDTLILDVPLSGTGVRTTDPGDANGDGTINVQDVICIINCILDPTFSPGGNPDCNEDGNVNVQDVICVINKILGV